MDKEFIRRLSEEVTVAPICAKADAMTDTERRAFQQHIRSELQACEYLLLLPASNPCYLMSAIFPSWLGASTFLCGLNAISTDLGLTTMTMMMMTIWQ